MRRNLTGLACVLAVLCGCTTRAQKANAAFSQNVNAAVADIQINDPKPYPFKFVAYGDLRFAEHESYVVPIANAKARQQVIDQIGREAPAFLVATGDFVFRGFHAEDWTYFDRAIKPLRDRGIQIFPAIGNHEVGPFSMGRWGPEALQEIEKDTDQHIASRGLENYYKEFPNISHKPWYSVRYANCYFLMLDSETEDDQTIAAQEKWISDQLDAMPSDIDYIFAAMHRAPHTAPTKLNDTVHMPRKMETDLSQLLEKRQKTTRARIIVISGHVHNYQRFLHGDVTYIVSGGGGAEPAKFVPHRADDDLYPKNLLYGKDDPADEDQFHYCLFTVDHSKLAFQMMKLVGKENNVAFEPRDSFAVDAGQHRASLQP
jgi:hypothetical protein